MQIRIRVSIMRIPADPEPKHWMCPNTVCFYLPMVKLYKLMMKSFWVSSSVIPRTITQEAIRITFLAAPKDFQKLFIGSVSDPGPFSRIQIGLLFPCPDPDKIRIGSAKKNILKPVLRIRIRTDPHKEMPPGSGSAWTDADPDLDPGGKKA